MRSRTNNGPSDENANCFTKQSITLLLLALTLVCTPAIGMQRQTLDSAAQEIFVAGADALKRGNFQSAVRAFQKVLEIDRAFAPAHLNLGLALHALNEYRRAVESFEKAVELDDRLASAHLFLGIDYYELNAPDKAIKPLQRALALMPSKPEEAHLWLGKSLLAAGRFREAIPHMEKASEAYPEDLTVTYSLGRAHLLLSQQIFGDLYKKNPQSFLVHFLLGQSYHGQGKLELAAAEFRTALKLNPRARGAHEALGDIAWRQKQLEEAEREFRQELEIDPYNSTVKFKLGRLLNQTGKVDEAIPYLKDAVSQNPSLSPAWCELGKVMLREAKYEEAMSSLQSAIAQDSEYAPAYFLLGQVYAKLGKQDKAQAVFQKGRLLREQQLKQIQESLGSVHQLDEELEP